MNAIVRYLATLSNARLVLWCYFLWYLGTVLVHFDPSPALWLNALGISAVIGIALVLSVGDLRSAARQPRQTARLFAMPFCVSSFSALIKDRGFVLFVPPQTTELLLDLALCAAFLLLAFAVRRHAAAAKEAPHALR